MRGGWDNRISRREKFKKDKSAVLFLHLLELLHVEELHGALHLDRALRHFEDVVADGAALVVQGVLHEDVAVAEALDEDVSRLVHLHLAAGADLQLELGRLGVAQGILEPVHSDSEMGRRRLRIYFEASAFLLPNVFSN